MLFGSCHRLRRLKAWLAQQVADLRRRSDLPNAVADHHRRRSTTIDDGDDGRRRRQTTETTADRRPTALGGSTNEATIIGEDRRRRTTVPRPLRPALRSPQARAGAQRGSRISGGAPTGGGARHYSRPMMTKKPIEPMSMYLGAKRVANEPAQGGGMQSRTWKCAPTCLRTAGRYAGNLRHRAAPPSWCGLRGFTSRCRMLGSPHVPPTCSL